MTQFNHKRPVKIDRGLFEGMTGYIVKENYDKKSGGSTYDVKLENGETHTYFQLQLFQERAKFGIIYITEEALEYLESLSEVFLESGTDTTPSLTKAQLKEILIEAKKGDRNNRVTLSAELSDKKDIRNFRVTKYAKMRGGQRLPKTQDTSTGAVSKITDAAIKQYAQGYINISDVMFNQVKEGEPRVLYLSVDGNVAISEMNEIVTIYTKKQFIEEEDNGWVIPTLNLIEKFKKENKEKALQ